MGVGLNFLFPCWHFSAPRVQWRGKWQAGIKCERADWPLATVKAKPTHDRKNYVVIFFPHKKNYSWADTLLVCSIDEFPQPIAHRSHKVGVQLVEDLTVARRFIMKKLVIGMLNIVDQLPLQVNNLVFCFYLLFFGLS